MFLLICGTFKVCVEGVEKKPAGSTVRKHSDILYQYGGQLTAFQSN